MLISFVAFVRLGRPKFLVGGFLLFGLGAAIAARTGHAIHLQRYIFGQLAVTAFQWMTHYANDFFDYDADRANLTPTKWSGGSRVLQTHQLPRRIAFDAAQVLAIGGACMTVLLVRVAGGWVAPILGVIFVLAWEYSAPPLRLCATGAGELTTAVVVTGLVPLLGFYVQAPDLNGVAMLGSTLVPLALLQLAMSIAIELPDAAGDVATGKRTLVVRLGATRSVWLYRGLTIAAYAWLPLSVALGESPRIAIAAALTAPVALWRIRAIDGRGSPSAVSAPEGERGSIDTAPHEQSAFFAVFLFATTAIAELVAVLL